MPLDQGEIEMAPLLDQRCQQPVAHNPIRFGGGPARPGPAMPVRRKRPEAGRLAHLLDETDRLARAVIDRGIQPQRSNAGGQRGDPPAARSTPGR
jgi:hypothetical protein